MNFAALKVLIASDSANATKTDQQVANWANASITVKRPINLRDRSEEHTSELQSHSFISYAVFCLKKKNTIPSNPSSSPVSFF